jgi:hypothetical protein
MTINILIDGKSIVKIDLDADALIKAIRAAMTGGDTFQSTPASVEQMKQLLARIDERSVSFLKALASSKEGSLSWAEMRKIFGIKEEDNWNAYSGSFGKGITRAYRNILGDKTARLVWWIDKDWEEYDWDDDLCCVYVDGQALQSLRSITGS